VSPGRARFALSFDQMAIALLFVVLACLALLMPAQNDTFWNLRDGLEILRAGHVPRIDTYSFTAAGAPYTDHEWLSQVILALAHRLAGMPGVELVAAVAVLGSVAIVYRLTVGPLRTRFALLAPALTVASCVWVLRPQVFSLLALAALVWMIVRERWAGVPVLFVVWANAHGGVVSGGLALAVATVVALLRWRARGEPADRRRLRALAIVAPLSAAATLLTPLGARLVPYILMTARRSRALDISEWAATLPTDGVGVAFWVVALGFGAVLVARRRALATAAWGDWALLGMTLAFLPIAIQSRRNMALFLMLAAPAASRLLGPDFRLRLRRARPDAPTSPDHPRLNAALAGGMALLAALVIATAWAAPIERLGWRPLPPGALAALRGCQGPLYNHYDDGGFLIWFAPERKVFVDSRQDPYPLELLLEHQAIERGQRDVRPLLARYGITCAFLPDDSRTVKTLASMGWATRFRDERYVVQAAPAR
jgi:hypothetical protein